MHAARNYRASGCWLGAQIIIGKLDYGNWTHWPVAEQDAILAFFATWWRDNLEQYSPPIQPGDAIGSIARCDELTRYLQIAGEAANDNLAVRRNLMRLICHTGRNVMDGLDGYKRFWEIAWWDEHPLRLREFMLWLLSDEIAATLRRPFLDRQLERTQARSRIDLSMDLLAMRRYATAHGAYRRAILETPIPAFPPNNEN